jgi:hypothetical protein
MVTFRNMMIEALALHQAGDRPQAEVGPPVDLRALRRAMEALGGSVATVA